MPHLQHRQHQNAKRVSFRETCSVELVEPLRTSLTPQERDTVWCTPAEMEAFHSEVRNVCRQLRSNRHDFIAPEASLRGLELRRSAQRQKRKCMTIQCVLMAQRRMKMKHEALARFASKCSQWASQVAAVQGQHDFLLAYAADSVKDGNITQYLSPLPAMTAFPVPLKQPEGAGQKRSSVCDSEEGTPERCVRRRTSVY